MAVSVPDPAHVFVSGLHEVAQVLPTVTAAVTLADIALSPHDVSCMFLFMY